MPTSLLTNKITIYSITFRSGKNADLPQNTFKNLYKSRILNYTYGLIILSIECTIEFSSTLILHILRNLIIFQYSKSTT